MSAAGKTSNARWIMAAVLHLSVLIAYLNRLNLSFALPVMAREFGWDTAQVGRYGGMLLSLFFVGYGAAGMALSPLAAYFGPRRSLLTVFLLFSCLTIAGAPLGAWLAAFAASRLLLGVVQGVHFPMMTALTKDWFPIHERSRGTGIFVGGLVLAPLLAPVFLVPMVESFGWRNMFAGVGLLGVLIGLPPLWCFVFDTPRKSPWVSEAEAAYIEAGLEQKDLSETGWRFLQNGLFWLALAGGSLNNFFAFGILFWLPTYLTEGRGMPFSELRYAAAMPYLAGIAGVGVMAWLGDWLNRRALLAGLGFLIAAACVYLAASASGLFQSVACFAGAAFFQAAYAAQEFALLQRILPHGSIGRGAGLYNGIAVLVGGGLSSAVVGGMVSLTGTYTAGLLCIVASGVLGGTTLLILAHFLKY